MSSCPEVSFLRGEKSLRTEYFWLEPLLQCYFIHAAGDHSFSWRPIMQLEALSSSWRPFHAAGGHFHAAGGPHHAAGGPLMQVEALKRNLKDHIYNLNSYGSQPGFERT
jgi:hypothetical protein